jgi:predicted PurR-regulated permease PerM
MQRIASAAVQAGSSNLVNLAVVIALLYWGRVFFITFAVAVALAFILEPFVGMLMRVRLPRALASFVVCSLALLALYLIGLAGYSQISGLMDDYQQNYSQRVAGIVEKITNDIEALERTIYSIIVPARQQAAQEIQQEQARKTDAAKRRRATDPVPATLPQLPPPIPEVRIRPDRSPVTSYIYDRLESVYQLLLMSSFVPFLVYFMLSWRDHIQRSFLQFFQGEDRTVAAKSLQGIAEMVRAFVLGNFALGLLLAAASSLIFWKLNVPYPLLVGPLSGFVSLIPYIGLPLAMLPPLAVGLAGLHSVSHLVLVAAIVTGLHVLALNLLYPKIVGSRVHLNPLVVTVALMFWGFLWDAAGLVLAIPLTAGTKAVCDNVRSLRHYGKLLGD